MLRCIFRVLRVSSFNGLYSAPRPFLLTLTTVNVDTRSSISSSDLYSIRQPTTFSDTSRETHHSCVLSDEQAAFGVVTHFSVLFYGSHGR